MPVYPVVNKNTGEQKEVSLSISEWENFKKENDEWIRDWSDPSTVPNNCETGEWKDKLIKKHPGWNDVLEKASRAPKSRVKKI